MCGVTSRAAAFLDRDGTINLKAPEGDYIKSPAELRLLPGAAEAIRRLNDAGTVVIVVSNQRGIALGRMSEQDLEAVHADLAKRLRAESGAQIDAFLHCPHDVGQCACRKPRPGMLAEAVRRFPEIDLGQSVLIGDAASDIEAGRSFGVNTVQLGVDASSLMEAVGMLASSP